MATKNFAVPIKLFYCRTQNFGDALNTLIFERVLGVPVRYAKKRWAELCGIGSLLDALIRTPSIASLLTRTCRPPIHVFSSGFMFPLPSLRVRPLRTMVVHAVRGRQTYQQLVDLGVVTPEQVVAYGDAGLFAPLLLERTVSKRYFCGIIPHIVERNCAEIEVLSSTIPNSTVIDFGAPPLSVLERMASCEMIVSSAMHGLIVADALGIPNIWMEVSDRISGGRHKFNDYYSAYVNYKKKPVAVYNVAQSLTYGSCPSTTECETLQRGLRQAFLGCLNTMDTSH